LSETDIRIIEKHQHTTTVLWPFFWDHPGEPVPEENFWTLWFKGKLPEADTDTPTIHLGATLSGLTSAHLQHPHFFTGRMPFLPPNHVKALKATRVFGLQRRCYSSPQWCYVHRLCTIRITQKDAVILDLLLRVTQSTDLLSVQSAKHAMSSSLSINAFCLDPDLTP